MERNINYGNVVEEVDEFLFDMPVDYSLGHCVAKDMRMSAGIAVYFKLVAGGRISGRLNRQFIVMTNALITLFLLLFSSNARVCQSQVDFRESRRTDGPATARRRRRLFTTKQSIYLLFDNEGTQYEQTRL